MLSKIKAALTSRPVFVGGWLLVVLVAGFLIWIELTFPSRLLLPVPSPDGKYFAYFDLVRGDSSGGPGDFDLIIATPRGRQMARFARETGSIFWSNAGHLAVVDGTKNQATLVANAEGRFLVLTQVGLLAGSYPRWSRDGMKLAYARPASAGAEIAVYDMQQPQAYSIPFPPEFRLEQPTVLFWSAGSQELYFLNTEGQDAVLEMVEIPTGRIRALGKGPQSWKNPEFGLLRMSADGSKIYLPRPQHAVIDAQTGEILWRLPAEAAVLWSAWSADGTQLFYARQARPSEISAHDFLSQTDQVVLANARSNGFFTVDGRSYFYCRPPPPQTGDFLAGFRQGLKGEGGWQHVDVSTEKAQPMGSRELLPWEQTQDGWILAKQEDLFRARFGLYDPNGRALSEYAFPTAREDFFRQLKSQSIFLASLGLYALIALFVYWKRPASPPARALYLLSLVLMLLFASMGAVGRVVSTDVAAPPFGVKAAGTLGLAWLQAIFVYRLIPDIVALGMMCLALVPPALLHFAIVFPEGNKFLLRREALWPLLYGAALLPLLVFVGEPLLHPGPEGFERILLMLGTAIAWPAVAGTAVMALVHNYRHPRDRRAKDQVRWVMWAFAFPFLGLLAMTVVAALPRLSGGWVGEMSLRALNVLFTTTLVPLFCLLPPLAIGYALVAHKLFDIRLLARRTVRYSLITFVVAVVYLLCLGGLSYAIAGSLEHPSVPVAVTSTLLTGLIIAPVRNRLQEFIGRTFDRTEYDIRETLQKFANSLPMILDRQALGVRMSETVRQSMRCRRFYLFVLDRHSKKLRLQLAPGAQAADVAGVAFDPAEPLCRWLLDEGRPFEVEVSPYDPKLIPIFRSAEERLGKLEAAVIFGLDRRGELLGLMVLGPKVSEEFYNAEELELLTTIARQAAVAVENTDLFEELAQDREQKKELEVASEVQAQLFPSWTPQLRGCEIAGRCLPASSVSGDYYDFLELPGKRIGLAIGDVAGKGMSASLLMANLQGLVRTQAPTAESLAELVRRINRQLYVSSRGAKYCTFFYGIYDDSGRKFEFVNAGHNPPLVLADGKARFLESTGVPLGLFPEVTHETRCAMLEPGTLLVLYSDGITEARNARGELYGVDRLVNLVARSADQDTAGLVEKILGDVREFTGGVPVEDDQTLVLLKVSPA